MTHEYPPHAIYDSVTEARVNALCGFGFVFFEFLGLEWVAGAWLRKRTGAAQPKRDDKGGKTTFHAGKTAPSSCLKQAKGWVWRLILSARMRLEGAGEFEHGR